MARETNYLGCILAGAAAGFVLGVMLAPDKGSNTRDRVKTKFKDYQDKAEDLMDDIKSKGKNLVKEGKNYIKKEKDNLLREEDDQDSFI